MAAAAGRDDANPPWPDRDSAMLKFLLAKARASIDAGMDVDTALL
ncbi:hypothetical protein [Nocardioides ultimimeridianus]